MVVKEQKDIERGLTGPIGVWLCLNLKPDDRTRYSARLYSSHVFERGEKRMDRGG